jgi:hypothetical protein
MGRVGFVLLTLILVTVAAGLWIKRDELGDLIARSGVGEAPNSSAVAAQEFMSKLEQEFPEQHAEMLAEIRRLESQQATREEAYAAGQAVLSDFLASHVGDLARADEGSLNELAQRRAEALSLLQTDNITACAEFSRGAAVSAPVGLAVGDEARAAVLWSAAAYLDAITSARHSPQTLTPLSQGELEALLSSFTSASLEVMASDGTTEFSDERVCASEVEHWRAIVQSPMQLRARATQHALLSIAEAQTAASYADIPPPAEGRPTAGDLQLACQRYLSGTRGDSGDLVNNRSPAMCVVMSDAAIRSREGAVPGGEARFCLPDSPGMRANPANSMARAYLTFYEARARYLEEKDGALIYVAAMINSWPCAE